MMAIYRSTGQKINYKLINDYLKNINVKIIYIYSESLLN